MGRGNPKARLPIPTKRKGKIVCPIQVCPGQAFLVCPDETRDVVRSASPGCFMLRDHVTLRFSVNCRKLIIRNTVTGELYRKLY